MNKQINVRALFEFETDIIMGLKTNLDLVFEDGVEIKNCYYKDVILFRYLLDFIPKYEIPIISKYWIVNYYKNGFFTGGSYTSLYSKIYREINKTWIEKHGNNKIQEVLFKDMYITMDKVNRELVRNVINYVVSCEVDDILEIQFEQELMEAIAEAAKAPSQKSIENTYKVLDKVIKQDKYENNPIALFYKSGVVSIDQIRQLLGSRGYLTEIDSKIFHTPMTNSFALGFKNMYDAAIESRAGAKALYLSGKAIQDSEYTARELQLATMVVEHIHIGDCGNPTYVDFFVRPKQIVDGKVIYDGDLPNLIGKRYLDTDGVEKIIQGDETHLEETYIKLRMGVYCGLKDKKKICSACLGEIGETVFNHFNLGHIATTNVSARVTQSILSTKHLLKSAAAAPVKLDLVAKKYFMLKGSEKLLFKANVLNKKTKEIYLKIKQREAWGIRNAMAVKDIFSININKVSRISEIFLVFKGKNSIQEVPITLKSGNRYAYLTIDLISYIINNGLETVDEEFYSINISNFNPKKPIFLYEKVEFDFQALSKEFKSLLKTRKYKVVDGKLRSEYQPHVLVQKLFELINNKLSVNIALLEVMVYAFTVQNLGELNYDLGRNTPHRDVVGFKEAIDYRSIGASYDWDNLQNKVLDPVAYMEENKPSHPMDVFFKPVEVVKNESYLDE